MTGDLTQGKPGAVLWRFALPMLLSVAFQQIYSIADSVIVGKYVGDNALAAVSASYPVTTLFIAVTTGFSAGAGVVISRLFGGEEYKKMKCAASTSLITSTVVSIILTIIGLVVSEPVLEMLGTDESIFSDSVLYLDIYCLGLFFLFLYNISNGIFTALGDSRTPLILLIISSLLNIVLDLYFVISLHWGVGGAAWATLIAQGVSAVAAYIIIALRLHKIKIPGGYSHFSWRALPNILKLAIPSIFQTGFVSVGNLFIQARVNYFGVDVIAGYGAAIKLNTFAITCFNTVSNAISSYTAQNMGHKMIERVTEGLKEGVKLMFAIAAPFIIAYTVFGNFFMGLFAEGGDSAIIEIGRIMLLIIAPFYLFVGFKIVCDGILRGSGAIYAFTTSTFMDLILRVVLCYILSNFWDEVGIWLAWPVGWILAAAMSFAFYKNGHWKKC